MDRASLIVLAFTALSGAALFLVLWRKRRSWLAAMTTLLARRGWRLEDEQPHGGKAARLVLRPDVGDWRVTVLRGDCDVGEDICTTTFTTVTARHDGLVVIGPSLPPGQAGIAAGFLALLSGPFGQKALAALIGDDLAPMAPRLAPVPGFEPAVVLTDSPLPAPLAAGVLAATRALDHWTPREAGENGRPVVILSPGGLKLRLRHALKAPADLEAFADLGLRLAAGLGAAE